MDEMDEHSKHDGCVIGCLYCQEDMTIWLTERLTESRREVGELKEVVQELRSLISLIVYGFTLIVYGYLYMVFVL